MSARGFDKQSLRYMKNVGWPATSAQKVAFTAIVLLAAIAVFASVIESWIILGVTIGLMIASSAAIVLAATSLLSSRLEQFFQQAVSISQSKNPTHQEGSGHAGGATTYWANSLRRNDPPLKWFVNHAKRTRSLSARDVIASAATGNRYSYANLELLLENMRIDKYAESSFAAVRSQLWKPGILGMAQILYSQRLSPFDLVNATTLYELAQRAWGHNCLTDGVDRSYYSDLLTESGRYKEARAILEYDERNSERVLWHQFLKLNTVNPWLPETRSSINAWLSDLNTVYADHGLSEIDLVPGEGDPFLRLTGSAPTRRVDGPMVSVLMPLFRPDGATDIAIQSILNQSWENIELIIVDDGSPQTDDDGRQTDYRERLEKWESVDPRIVVIYNAGNRGAYWARNTAYAHARGRYITVADKDDWHHPQKLEIQISDLESREAVANITNWIRVDSKLRFLLRWGPDRLIHPSFASIMFRHQEVKERLGYWDNVRKSADGEFKLRLQKVFGVELQAIEPMPLAFSLIGEDNLTSGDLGLGYINEDRRAYAWAYGEWHRQIEGGAPAYLPREPLKRPFPAPPSFLPSKPDCGTFDLVYVSEFGFEAGNATVLRNEIEVAVAAGLRVGIMPMQNFLIRSASTREISAPFIDMLRSGEIEWLSSAAKARCGVVIVRWPAVLQVARDEAREMSAGEVLIVANHMPYEGLGDRRSYDITRVTETARRIFGLEPVWVPESERVLEVLRGLVPRDQLASSAWKGIVARVKPRRTDWRSGGRVPVIGRHARDHEGKWPSDRDEFRSIYRVDGSVQVSILGGASIPVRRGYVEQDELEAWQVFGFNEVSVDEFLDGLDFFVYFHNRGMVEAYGMAIVEALNAGVVCVLPRGFRAVFGDAAVYCSPQEVQETVAELWKDKDAYMEQRERGYDYVEREASPQAYLRRLMRFGVSFSES